MAYAWHAHVELCIPKSNSAIGKSWFPLFCARFTEFWLVGKKKSESVHRVQYHVYLMSKLIGKLLDEKNNPANVEP